MCKLGFIQTMNEAFELVDKFLSIIIDLAHTQPTVDVLKLTNAK